MLGLLASKPAHAFWPFEEKGLKYSVEVTGADDEMQSWLATLALDEMDKMNPLTTLDELDVEASRLSEKVKKALFAKGYVEAMVEPQLDKTSQPPVIQISIEQGPRYPVSAIEMRWPGNPLIPLDHGDFSSKEGTPLDIEAIENDAVALHEKIAKQGCVLSLSVTPKLQLLSATRTAKIIFEIDHGAAATFGASVIHGNQKVKDVVIQRAIDWKQGECFQESHVERTRTTLIESRLFASVEIIPETSPGPEGQAAMQIMVKERVQRSIAAGVDYSTDMGAGIYGSWEHRNFFGAAEKLNTNLTLAQRQQGIRGKLRVPNFLRDDQVLVFSSMANRESLDAYEAFSFDNSVGLERQLRSGLKAGLGAGYTLSQTKDELTGRNNYALLSLPGFIEYDTRNDVPDPRHGLLTRLNATPYTETLGEGGQFLKLQAIGQHYLSNDELPLRPTFATRISAGSIYGARGDAVPADIRFYAGGGGSVRGFTYQSLSPYFQGDPIGGSSLLELSGEVRLRFSDTFGGVLFMDAGNAYSSSTPDLSEPLYVGAGTGIRYYSPIGPLRFDVAFPLNGTRIGQEGYQIYVSLGQAF